MATAYHRQRATQKTQLRTTTVVPISNMLLRSLNLYHWIKTLALSFRSGSNHLVCKNAEPTQEINKLQIRPIMKHQRLGLDRNNILCLSQKLTYRRFIFLNMRYFLNKY